MKSNYVLVTLDFLSISMESATIKLTPTPRLEPLKGNSEGGIWRSSRRDSFTGVTPWNCVMVSLLWVTEGRWEYDFEGWASAVPVLSSLVLDKHSSLHPNSETSSPRLCKFCCALKILVLSVAFIFPGWLLVSGLSVDLNSSEATSASSWPDALPSALLSKMKFIRR